MTFQSRFKLQRYFDSIGETIDLNSLESRIALQKKAYFMQVLGLVLDYRFSWYLHGPYSTSLADDGYAIRSMRLKDREAIAGKIAIDDEKHDLQIMKALLKSMRTELKHLQDHERLELAASLHFLAKRTFGSKYKRKNIINRLKHHKPEFETSDIKIAWKVLTDFLLV